MFDNSTRLHVSVPQDLLISSVMNGSAYPRGRLAAQKAYEYFSRYREQLPDTRRECIAPVPSADVIEAVIDAAFWASLRREEGYMPRLSLAILDPQQARQPLLFENGLPLTPDSLAKVSPAVVRPCLHIAVSRCRDELCVWRTVRRADRRRRPLSSPTGTS